MFAGAVDWQEQVNDEAYNHKCDVWAVGCIVYEMAALRFAHIAHTLHTLHVAYTLAAAAAVVVVVVVVWLLLLLPHHSSLKHIPCSLFVPHCPFQPAV